MSDPTGVQPEFPALDLDEVPAVTAAQMRAVDRLMVQEVGADFSMMMENAGRALAEVTRRLATWGARARGGGPRGPEGRFRGVPGRQLAILKRLAVPTRAADHLAPLGIADVVLDALLRYGGTGDPREPVASLIRTANTAGSRIVALDPPSGLDADSGVPGRPAVCAAATITLALPKTGLLRSRGPGLCGRLYLADISVPAGVYGRLGLVASPWFARSDTVRLARRDRSSQRGRLA